MAIQALKKKERQTLLGLVFVVVVFLIIVVIFFGLIKGEKVVTSSDVVPAYIPKTIEIDFEILKSPIFQELEMFEEIGMPKTKGRDNPFLPYLPTAE